VKCENHFCSILLTKYLLGEEWVKTIEQHRKKRIDAQYYLKIVSKKDVKEMLRDAKVFVTNFENFIVNLKETALLGMRHDLNQIIEDKIV